MKDKTLKIEIDDIALGQDFVPQVKITKWEEESKFNVKLIHTEDKTDVTVVKEGEKTKWKAKNLEVHFYDIPEDSEHHLGAYEFEVVLLKKKAGNTIEFDIESENLDFRYQGELTQEDIDDGDIRPDNVVGSYAVYHSSKSNNDYMTGKAFHIYRPTATDDNGNWTWGEIFIDVIASKLIVTIDQGWLDNAKYPVLIDPTFGRTDVGASSTGRNANIYMGAINTSGADAAGATVDKMTFYSSSSGDNFKTMVIDNSTYAILTNGVSEIGVTAGGWVDTAFTTPPTIAASTAYQLGLIQETKVNIHYDSGSAWRDATNSYTTPEEVSNGTSDSKYFSIYATYTTAGPATIDFADTLALTTLTSGPILFRLTNYADVLPLTTLTSDPILFKLIDYSDTLPLTTLTSDPILSLGAIIDFANTLALTTLTSDVKLFLLKNFSDTLGLTTLTSDALLGLLTNFADTINITTLTSTPILFRTTNFSDSLDLTTLTGDATLDIISLISFANTLALTTLTSDVKLALLTNFANTLGLTTLTSDTILFKLSNFSDILNITTLTSDPILFGLTVDFANTLGLTTLTSDPILFKLLNFSDVLNLTTLTNNPIMALDAEMYRYNGATWELVGYIELQ